MARERDIRNAIQKALAATNAFDGVFLWGFKDAAEQGAEFTRAVVILPMPDKELDIYDDVMSGQMFIDAQVKLVVMVRDENAQQRDEDADLLVNTCRNALNGAALNAFFDPPEVYPQWTKVGPSTWKEPVPPQREIECIFQYRFDAPTWTGFDTSE